MGFGKTRIAGQHIAEPSAGSVQVRLRRFRQGLPGKYDVIPVHNQVLLPGLPDGHLRRGRFPGGGIPGPPNRAELPLHDLFQLPVVNGGPLHKLGRFLFLDPALQVHILLYLVPLHIVARAMGAEHRIRRVFRVAFRVVARFRNHRFPIVAGRIAVKGQGQPAHPLGIGCQYLSVIPDLRRGNPPLQGRGVSHAFGGLQLAAHGP